MCHELLAKLLCKTLSTSTPLPYKSYNNSTSAQTIEDRTMTKFKTAYTLQYVTLFLKQCMYFPIMGLFSFIVNFSHQCTCPIPRYTRFITMSADSLTHFPRQLITYDTDASLETSQGGMWMNRYNHKSSDGMIWQTSVNADEIWWFISLLTYRFFIHQHFISVLVISRHIFEGSLGPSQVTIMSDLLSIHPSPWCLSPAQTQVVFLRAAFLNKPSAWLPFESRTRTITCKYDMFRRMNKLYTVKIYLYIRQYPLP